MKITLDTIYRFGLIAAGFVLITACSDDERIIEVPVETVVEVEVPVEVPAPVPPPVPFSYTVSITNLTHAQPLSPVAVVLHEVGNLWKIGDVASVEIEVMAEGGNNQRLIDLPFASATASGAAPVPPGESESITITVNDVPDGLLSIATMLVNTNDAFTGLNAYPLSGLEVGDTFTTVVGAYDSGTERNTELAGTIPGPADGGEGFNPTRDDVGFVARHPGVVGNDDGLSTSILNSAYKFDNPTMRVSITRTE